VAPGGVGAVAEVTFIEQSLEAFTYRDGVRFANGREILLQRLRCGQRAEVRVWAAVRKNHSLSHICRRFAASSSGARARARGQDLEALAALVSWAAKPRSKRFFGNAAEP
jgi:hypothetical protein